MHGARRGGEGKGAVQHWAVRGARGVGGAGGWPAGAVGQPPALVEAHTQSPCSSTKTQWCGVWAARALAAALTAGAAHPQNLPPAVSPPAQLSRPLLVL